MSAASIARVFSTPPHRLSNEQRSWLRRNRAEADRYEARWGVTLF